VSSISVKAAVSDAARLGTELTTFPSTPTTGHQCKDFAQVHHREYARAARKVHKLKQECLKLEAEMQRKVRRQREWVRENGSLRRTTPQEKAFEQRELQERWREAELRARDYSQQTDIRIDSNLRIGEVSPLRDGERWMMDEEARALNIVTQDYWTGKYTLIPEHEKWVDEWVRKAAEATGCSPRWAREWFEREAAMPALYRIGYWKNGVPKMFRVWRTLGNWHFNCQQPNWAT
jgi:hypothetical protein